MQDPAGWLFKSSLMVLTAAIALQIAVCIVAGIWQWLAGLLLISIASAITVRILQARRNRW